MDESHLLALAISFLVGFVIFKKDKSVVLEDTKKEKLKNTRSSSFEKKEDNRVSELSGVSRYLNTKETVSNEENSIESSGVAKYLESKEKTSLSGVSKYMVRQSIDARQKAKDNISGVEKYLNNKD